MNQKQKRAVFDRTGGHCHFCGDRLKFEKNGWLENDRQCYWEVDHVFQKGKGGSKKIENCLAACTRCNRLRWHRKGNQIRELLLLGLIAKHQIKSGTPTGKVLTKLKNLRRLSNTKRRQS